MHLNKRRRTRSTWPAGRTSSVNGHVRGWPVIERVCHRAIWRDDQRERGRGLGQQSCSERASSSRFHLADSLTHCKSVIVANRSANLLYFADGRGRVRAALERPSDDDHRRGICRAQITSASTRRSADHISLAVHRRRPCPGKALNMSLLGVVFTPTVNVI